MRKPLTLSLAVPLTLALFLAPAAIAIAKKVPGKNPGEPWLYRYAPPGPADLPPEIQALIPPKRATTATDTFHLAWYGWDDGTPQGWVNVDLNDQLGTFFHVADGTELDGGSMGKLVPLQGSQSMWCGQAATAAAPFCGYATLPGYGDNWIQFLESKTFACDSVFLCYHIRFDTEPEFDETFIDHWDEQNQQWSVIDSINGGSGSYSGTDQLVDCVMFRVSNADTTSGVGETRIRFRFESDADGSDEDGVYPSDGAVTIDSITVQCWDIDGGTRTLLATLYEDFEDEAPGAQTTDDGCWTAAVRPGYRKMAALYDAIRMVQEDPCFMNTSKVYAFIEEAANANYACGGFPEQGAVPYKDENGAYIMNEIWSPRIPFTGTGNKVVLDFLVYRDLPFDALVFHVFHVRSWQNDCPGEWRDPNALFFGTEKSWVANGASLYSNIGHLIDPGAEEVQLALGVVDMCGNFCGVWGDGSCHSHSPLFDDVHLTRINVVGPQWVVRHFDLFQDNFASDGTLTGHVRADMAQDVAPGANASTIRPGDSVLVEVTDVSSGLGIDPDVGGAAVYAYVAVWPPGQPGKAGPELEAPEVGPNGTRFPLVDSLSYDGATWYCLRFDSVRTADGVAGGSTQDLYCFDLNDRVFTPGDTVCYLFCAENTIGEKTYFSRRLDGQGPSFQTDDLSEALSSPMEFTCLPAAGWIRGGYLLYVDDADDRVTPQFYIDEALVPLFPGLHMTDRFDVLGSGSSVGNSLASRVKNVFAQLIDCYKVIMWSSGNLTYGTIGDGSNDPEKSDDFELLHTFLDQHPDNPGLYLTGDNIASEWASLSGQSAIDLEGEYMDYTLVSSDHHGGAQAEPQSPLLRADPGADCFIDVPEGPDEYIAYGGCPQPLGRFDLLYPTGASIPAFENPHSGQVYSLTQETANSNGSTARVMLEGHSFDVIRDATRDQPLARIEHLYHVLLWTSHSVVIGSGVDETPQFTDFLAHAYPNPFNPKTTIRYGIRESGHVSLTVYNVAGQLVRRLVNELQSPRVGGFAVEWDGRSDAGEPVASGVYFYKLVATDFTQTKKMVLLK